MQVWKAVEDACAKSRKKRSQPPTSLQGQMLWREFYYTAAFGTRNFHRMEGNELCIQIPWQRSEERLAAWKEGRTGFPWIDACMIQLRKTGEHTRV